MSGEIAKKKLADGTQELIIYDKKLDVEDKSKGQIKVDANLCRIEYKVLNSKMINQIFKGDKEDRHLYLRDLSDELIREGV